MVWSGRAGEMALGKVDDADGHVIEAFTGPQVAWGMARGRAGAFGGKILNAWWMWTALSVVFFLGLVDRRRIRSWHTADLLALLSFGFSLLFFNRGHIFMSASLGALPLAYLVVRTSWIGFRGRRANPALSWPVWLLAGFAVFLGGLRIGLNLETPQGVIDVGLAGVIGADRILDGQAPYGHMPDTAGRAAAPPTRTERFATTSRRTDAARPPMLAGTRMGRWPTSRTSPPCSPSAGPASGTRCRRPTRRRSPSTCSSSSACFSSVAASAGTPLGTALAFGWIAFPFTAYAMNANSNDTIMPAILVWGFWLGDLGRHTGCDDCACRLDEVRRAAAGPALAHLSERAPSPQRAEVRDRVRRRDAGGVLDPAVRTEPDDGDALLRRPDARLSARPRVAVLALGLGAVPRRRDPEPPRSAGDPPGRGPRARRRRRGDPAAQGPARAGCAERSGARRLRAHAHPLVVSLHPVVPTLRPARAAAAAAGAGPSASRR